MKDLYVREDILQLEDIFENEFSLPFLSKELPKEIIVLATINSKEQLERLLSEDYCLLVQIPSFPKYKALVDCTHLEGNEYFKLIVVDQYTYNENVWNLIYENEYSNGWSSFLLKNRANVKINLPISSSERISIEQMGSNEIIYISLELNELTICKW